MSEKIDLEIRELSVEFNKKILEFEKKHNNKWKVYVTLPIMSILPPEDFIDQTKFKLSLVYS